jgi:hypothetical protein
MVTATGSRTLDYQWSFGTTNLPGATNAVLTLTNLQFSQAGNYAVLVASPYGFINSSNALLTVIDRLDHFVWSPIMSPRFVNAPFAVAIQAEDVTNQLFTNFSGTISLNSTNGVAVSPPITGSFVQGTWTGTVTVSQPVTNLVLQARDQIGDSGLANPINVVYPPTVGMTVSGSSLVINWPIASPTFILEASSSLSPAHWVQVTPTPTPIGGQNFVFLSLSQTNNFYRLRYSGP